ncbi:ABC transporter ATP-binding protein [Williamsia sp. SKLECPSW1]
MLSLDHVDLANDDLSLVTDLTLVADPGTVLLVTGANGSGKSTLLHCIAGQRRPADGHISLDGIAADETDPRFRSRVSTYLGDDAVFAELTVAEHLDLLCSTRDVESNAGRDLLDGSGIGELSDRFPHTLSTGQRARFDLCAAFLPGAALVVLDEPETGLDEVGRGWLTQRMVVAREQGSVVVVATHRPEIADRLQPMTLEMGR